MTRDATVVGVVCGGLALIWMLLSWQPVDRHVDDSVQAVADPEPIPTQPTAPSEEPEPQLAALILPQPAAPAAKPEEPAPDDGTAQWPVPSASGPYAELKQAFESEPRDSNIIGAESAIQTGLSGRAVHPSLVDEVLCHSTVCRVRMRWTKERAYGCWAGLMHIVTDPVDGAQFEHNMGIDQPSDPNAVGERMVDVYLKLRSAK